MTWEHLERGSSPVDWCEGNYLVSPDIAEFVNTISNILFLLGPPFLIYLFKDYGRFIQPAIHLIWVLLIVVGLSSAYFHATLSLLGQLLDELTILWVFMATLSLFCPRRHFPRIFKRSRKRFCLSMTIFSIVATGLSFCHPAINAFALMFLAIPATYLLYKELKIVQDERVYRLGVRNTTILIMAIVCWINDRMFCDTWSRLNFPYLHGFWHILIFISAYPACVLFAYFFVNDERPESRPTLKYWPRNDCELGIPYVSINYDKKFDDAI
ncbi:alkaline ceramidase [Anopheles merus]|uniref:alkaline ceramidase n=1 Tax=Anopheles merus TaxID=30066 RepID=UPI001BE45B26|nr:alkaline ceramidase [Anopheles merus]XP_041778745.1 alkaline ceramidase [Anopheles merus]